MTFLNIFPKASKYLFSKTHQITASQIDITDIFQNASGWPLLWNFTLLNFTLLNFTLGDTLKIVLQVFIYSRFGNCWPSAVIFLYESAENFSKLFLTLPVPILDEEKK